MSSSKKWYASKGVWLGICTFLVGAVPVVQALVEKQDFSAVSILAAILGIAKVAERVTSSGKDISL